MLFLSNILNEWGKDIPYDKHTIKQSDIFSTCDKSNKTEIQTDR